MTTTAQYITILLIISMLAGACSKEESDPNAYNTNPANGLMQIPPGFSPMSFPEGNEFTQTRWELGKKLFYDPILSSDNSTSCATCHLPALAFSDNKAFSIGAEQGMGTRNSPTLANVGYHPYFTREGGVPTLEMQILVPIQEHNEFNTNIIELIDKLSANQQYVDMAQTAYNRSVDAFVITRSLATFERSLISGNSPYDQYAFQGNNNALNQAEKRGMELFFSTKTNCTACHSGFDFTDYSFQNNGLYETYTDLGRYRLTTNPTDSALFKVPTLRNIALTAPYMHDGSFNTLEEVITHYSTGGANFHNKSEAIQPFTLSTQEQNDLIAFLHALTDHDFVSNALFAP